MTVAVLLALATIAQAPDSATRARVLDKLHGVQDWLEQARGLAATFRVDLPAVSSAVLYNRAQRMRASCAGAGRALGQLDSVLSVSYPAGPPPAAAAALRSEGRALRGLLAQCRREYDTGAGWAQRADSVRAWAPFRLDRLEAALRR